MRRSRFMILRHAPCSLQVRLSDVPLPELEQSWVSLSRDKPIGSESPPLPAVIVRTNPPIYAHVLRGQHKCCGTEAGPRWLRGGTATAQGMHLLLNQGIRSGERPSETAPRPPLQKTGAIS